MAEQLPHTDPDLILARKVGQALSKELSFETIHEPVVQELVDFRSRIRETTSATEAPSDRLWEQIAKEMDEVSAGTPVRTLHSTAMRWAAAAVILVAAIVGIYYQYLQGPELVAQTDQSIERVILSDGSTVSLRPYSTLHLISDSENRQTYQLQGEGYFEVTHNPERQFLVQAGKGQVRVLGTTFIMSNWGDQTQVFLEEGSVRFEHATSTGSITLKPGQAATLFENEDQPTLTEAEIQEYTDWLQEELVFTQKPAGQVLAELEQHYDISIAVPDSIAETELSGTLSLKDRKAALRNLALSLGGTFSRTGNNRFTFVADEE